jgi:hypothetical protein
MAAYTATVTTQLRRILTCKFLACYALLRGPFRRQRKGEASESAIIASAANAVKGGGGLSVVACEKFWSAVYQHVTSAAAR